MGARFWSYFVPYREDLRAALEALREQEFRAGRFYQPSEVPPGVIGRLLGRPPSKPRPPASIREAIKIADTNATGDLRGHLPPRKAGRDLLCRLFF